MKRIITIIAALAFSAVCSQTAFAAKNAPKGEGAIIARVPEVEAAQERAKAAISKRLGNNWSLNSSYTANKNHNYVVSVPTSPNDDYFPIDTTWSWAYKLSGNWNMPKDFVLGTIMEAFSGPTGTRTYVFRAPGEAGGPALVQQTTVTLRLEPIGSQKEPAYAQVNMRLGKKLNFMDKSLLLSFDALNVFNTNAVKAATYV